LSLIGVPSSAGAYAVGQEEAPVALRAAGLVEQLRSAQIDVEDLGDSAVFRWRPDRVAPRAQHAAAVIDVVQVTSRRVAEALAGRRTAVVLGGDCTVGIGTVAGARLTHGSVGLIYFDLHADLNTPHSVIDGALDWMGLAHMLAIEGAIPQLASAVQPAPLLAPEQVVLFGHGQAHATSWERDQIERLGLRRFPLDDVAAAPTRAARAAVEAIERRAERYVVHLDVDVIDFVDAPLAENYSRNTGLTLAATMAALSGLLASDRLVALTVAELNPVHASAEEGLVERFASLLAAAWA
jgi:arginase